MTKILIMLALLLFSGCSDTSQGRLREERLLQEEKEAQRRWDQAAFTIKEAVTPLHPKVRAFALRMAGLFPGEYNFGQVCAIWYYLKNNWRYVSDPRGFDYFAPAFESIESGLSGDCDDFAILMASSIEAIGGSARVVLSYAQEKAHAYCEVYVSDDGRRIETLVEELAVIDAYRDILGDYPAKLKSGIYKIHFHRDAQGYWLNLDYSADYPGGPFFAAAFEVAIYPDGRWETIKN